MKREESTTERVAVDDAKSNPWINAAAAAEGDDYVTWVNGGILPAWVENGCWRVNDEIVDTVLPTTRLLPVPPDGAVDYPGAEADVVD